MTPDAGRAIGRRELEALARRRGVLIEIQANRRGPFDILAVAPDGKHFAGTDNTVRVLWDSSADADNRHGWATAHTALSELTLADGEPRC